jgi:hypothetical protein
MQFRVHFSFLCYYILVQGWNLNLRLEPTSPEEFNISLSPIKWAPTFHYFCYFLMLHWWYGRRKREWWPYTLVRVLDPRYRDEISSKYWPLIHSFVCVWFYIASSYSTPAMFCRFFVFLSGHFNGFLQVLLVFWLLALKSSKREKKRGTQKTVRRHSSGQFVNIQRIEHL